jgi:hypothetical protein
MSDEIWAEDDSELESQHQLADEELDEVMNTYSVILMYENGSQRVIRGIHAATSDDAVFVASTIERLDLSELVPEQPHVLGGAMASAQEVPIVHTPKGVRVNLGKLYLYPDGHANLVFGAVPEEGIDELNLPLTNALDVIEELLTVVRRMQNEVVMKRPVQSYAVVKGGRHS